MFLRFQKKKNFVVYFFTEFDVEIDYRKYGGGVQNSIIFSLHGTGKCNCQQQLTATVQQHAEFES